VESNQTSAGYAAKGNEKYSFIRDQSEISNFRTYLYKGVKPTGPKEVKAYFARKLNSGAGCRAN
jgi:hypothetical protein